MRRNELDYILNTLLDFNRDVSDIVFTVDKPLQAEVGGELFSVPSLPPIEKLTPFQTETIALNLIGGNQRLTEELLRTGSCDSSYTLSDQARFRAKLNEAHLAEHQLLRADRKSLVFDIAGDQSVGKRQFNTDLSRARRFDSR